MSDIPEIGSTWVHHSMVTEHSLPRYTYTVYDVTNENSVNPDYPVNVSYVGKNGRRWSKPLNNFIDRMLQVETPPSTKELALSKIKIFRVIGHSRTDTRSLEMLINDWLKTENPCIMSETHSTCVFNSNVVTTVTILYTE